MFKNERALESLYNLAQITLMNDNVEELLEKEKICFVMRGLPGSGKSTFCEKKLSSIPRINKDDLRLQFKDEGKVGKEQKRLIDEYCEKGVNFVIDNTHLNATTIGNLCGKLIDKGYNPIIIDMALQQQWDNPIFYLNECKERNNNRDESKFVPDPVINRMFLKNYKLNFGKTIICDLDGTLFNVDHRLPAIKQVKKDYETFYSLIPKDEPNQWCIDILEGLRSTHNIVFLTGRPMQTFDDTYTQLHALGFHNEILLMRDDRDKQKDFQLKDEIYNECLKDYDISFVLEDRQQVVDMWRINGLQCLQVEACDKDKVFITKGEVFKRKIVATSIKKGFIAESDSIDSLYDKIAEQGFKTLEILVK